MANDKNDKDKAKDFRKKNKRLKRERIYKKRLSKTEKKDCLKAKEADDNKEAGDDKDTCPSVSAIVAFFGFLAHVVTASPGYSVIVAAFLSLSALIVAFVGSLTPISVISSLVSAIGASISFCFSFFSFLVRLFLFSSPARHITPNSSSPRRVLRSILL